MDPSPPHTPAKRRAALEERDRRRKLLEAAWSRIEPELDRAGHAGSYRTARRDRRIVLIFDRRTPIDVRPLLEAHGVSHLFTLEVDRDAEDLQELGVSLRGVLDRGGFRSHGYGLNEDATGPLVFLTREPDSVGARRADAICERFAADHGCGADWEHDPGGPVHALTPATPLDLGPEEPNRG